MVRCVSSRVVLYCQHSLIHSAGCCQDRVFRYSALTSEDDHLFQQFVGSKSSVQRVQDSARAVREGFALWHGTSTSPCVWMFLYVTMILLRRITPNKTDVHDANGRKAHVLHDAHVKQSLVPAALSIHQTHLRM